MNTFRGERQHVQLAAQQRRRTPGNRQRPDRQPVALLVAEQDFIDPERAEQIPFDPPQIETLFARYARRPLDRGGDPGAAPIGAGGDQRHNRDQTQQPQYARGGVGSKTRQTVFQHR